MEFGPIVRAMLRNKVRFGLIIAEIALTLAVVSNCVALILHARREMSRPSGFDDDALIRVEARQLDPSARDEGRLDDLLRRDVEALRTTPGVASVMNTNFMPWDGGGSSTEVKPLGAPSMLRTQVYSTDAGVAATLGVSLEAGREFTPADVERDAERLRALNLKPRERDAEGKARERFLQEVIVTRAFAELAFGPGPHLGKLLEDSDGDHYQVVGVLDRFYNPYGWPIHEYAMFYPNRFRSYEGGAWFLVRAEPGRAAAVARAIEERLRRPGEAREVRVRLVADVRDAYFGPQRLVSMLMGSVVALLVAVTSLGVAGLTSFSVAERTRQIGTRRALGATTFAIVRYFLLENWLLTTAGLALGGALAAGLNVLLVSTVAGAKLHPAVVSAGSVALWAAGLGSALAPALRGARTSPAVATRNVLPLQRSSRRHGPACAPPCRPRRPSRAAAAPTAAPGRREARGGAADVTAAAPGLRVLIVEDQPAVARALELLLEVHDVAAVTADTAARALEIVDREELGLVIQDMNFGPGETSGAEGLALFRRIRAIDPGLPVLALTAWTSLEVAVEMIKAGAADYLAKPWDDAKLVAGVQNLLRLRQLSLENERLKRDGVRAREALARRHDLRGAVYESPAMHRAVALAVQVAPADVPVLVTGPNGAGKELIADIVQANSRRRAGPFVKVNAGALPDALLEAELFGAEAGAYTGLGKRRVGRFEAAGGGTLFLDEIGNLSPAGQAKLLRVLQHGEFERLGSNETRRADVRVVAATNADLRAAIKAGRFREDLFFRLNVIEIEVPALRDRPQDVLPLAAALLAREAGASPPKPLSPAARAALAEHPWPGNVRELANRIQRATLVAEGPAITPADLGLGREAPPAAGPADEGTREERQRLELLLRSCDGMISRAAAELNVSRQALYRRMQKLGIVLERRPKT